MGIRLIILLGLFGSIFTACASISRYQTAQVQAPSSVKVSSNRQISLDQVNYHFDLKEIDTNLLLELNVANLGDDSAQVGVADVLLMTGRTQLVPLRRIGRYDASGDYIAVKDRQEKFEVKGGGSAKVIYTFAGELADSELPQNFRLKGHLLNGDKSVPLSIRFAELP